MPQKCGGHRLQPFVRGLSIYTIVYMKHQFHFASSHCHDELMGLRIECHIPIIALYQISKYRQKVNIYCIDR